MEINQYPETWTSYIDRISAADPSLEGKVFDDLMMELIAESTELELNGCDMQTMHRTVIQLADSLIDDVRKKPKQLGNAANQDGVNSTGSAIVGMAVDKSYPVLPLCLEGVTNECLVERSIQIASQFRRDKDYNPIRNEFIYVSLALNQLGMLAPVFRDQPKIPYNKKEWEKHTPLLNDQIVIDLHWLHCRGERLLPRWPELKSLLQHAGEFDSDAIAKQIAGRGWTCDFRVNELITVCPRQQTQLMQLRSNEMKERFRTLLEGKSEQEAGKRTKRTKAEVSAVRMAIASWADNNHRVRGQEEMYEAIWLAMRLLGSKAKPKEIANLAAFRCGVKPLDRKTVVGKVDTLRKVLDEAGIPLGV
ncbi:MAG: hypothetical protein IV101_09375 [Dechloromonas sp.]|uniref:hypothetical protein n=1 Tax=Dechloromonas sp. TaxID=1917218 RepID=UPI0027F2B746|nr:hypothetical protein [Dechloromonas sp.]MBT9521096.1 hypothetical protein [Dechloromonas sp.]